MQVTTHNCDKCNYHTNLQSSFIRHCNTILHKTGKKKERSDSKPPKKCDKCNFEHKNKLNLKIHILNNHSTPQEKKDGFTHYCECCDFGVFTKSAFDIHLSTNRHKMKSV